MSRVLYQPCPTCRREIHPGDTIFQPACTSPIRGPLCYDCGVRILIDLDPEAARRLGRLSPCANAQLPHL